jgi:hypothetical protein
MSKKTARLETLPEYGFRAIKRILRPLVKFMIAQGITYPAASKTLKALFVDVARAEFPLEERRETDSRISMLTGIHRAEVKRLMLDNDAQNGDAPPAVSLGAQLAARWISDSDYVDKQGNPLPLARHAGDGGELSFEALVASIRTDIRSRPLLDEWLRLGVVELDEQDRVHLKAKAFVPARGFKEKAFYFSQNLHDHAAVSVTNMLDQAGPLLERSVYYNKLTPASVETLAKLSSELGMRAIQEVNRLALQLDRLDSNRPDADQRINFGIFFYTGPNDDVASAPPTKEPAPMKTKGSRKG